MNLFMAGFESVMTRYSLQSSCLFRSVNLLFLILRKGFWVKEHKEVSERVQLFPSHIELDATKPVKRLGHI